MPDWVHTDNICARSLRGLRTPNSFALAQSISKPSFHEGCFKFWFTLPNCLKGSSLRCVVLLSSLAEQITHSKFVRHEQADIECVAIARYSWQKFAALATLFTRASPKYKSYFYDRLTLVKEYDYELRSTNNIHGRVTRVWTSNLVIIPNYL